MQNYKKPPSLKGYVYSFDEAVKARDEGKILSIRLETSLRCNLDCKYCCNNSSSGRTEQLDTAKIYSLIDEACVLGAQSIVVIGGGEPTIDPRFRGFISKINDKGMTPVIFTNAQTLNDNLCSFLYDNNTSVIIKLDSIIPEKQDFLVAKIGACARIRRSIESLEKAGFLDNPDAPRAGASIVVTNYNIDTAVETWRFCRQHHFFPNLEMLIPNGRAGEEAIQPSSADYRKLKLDILKVDQNEFGYSWLPYTPLISAGCFQSMYNVYIDVKGWARPCSSIHAQVANVNQLSLAQVLKTEFFKIARSIDKNLNGKCGSCEHGTKCTGCRGMAFSMARRAGASDLEALCASDPTCWKAEPDNHAARVNEQNVPLKMNSTCSLFPG